MQGGRDGQIRCPVHREKLENGEEDYFKAMLTKKRQTMTVWSTYIHLINYY